MWQATTERSRLLLFVACGALALILGFVAISPAQAETLIKGGGYYYMFGLFAAFVFYGTRILGERPNVWRSWLRRPGWPGVVILLGAAFAIWSDPFKHKVLFDEYVLQGTAFQMHATKEVGSIVRAYDIQGTWLPIDTFLDKRPYFFTFLVSLVHDLTGYRLTNIFIVNATLAPVFLSLVYWLGAALAGRGAGLLAVGLLATMPLLAQQATGAGMELHNLTMLAAVMVAAVLYLRQPNGDRLAFLVLGAVLLSQSRYESVIFVVPAAAVILGGWLRAGRIFLSWPAMIAPLLLVPYALHNRVLSATPLLWQLHEGQTSRFSFAYLSGNLHGAWNFFFNLGPNLANSWYLSALGALGGIGALVMAWRWARTRQPAIIPAGFFVLIAFGAGIAANLVMLMFYYWSRLDDVIASRFALPMCLLLALLAVVALQAAARPARPLMRWAAWGLGAWVLGWCLPAVARNTYTSTNLVMQEVEWERSELIRHRGPILYISNKSTLPFLLWHIPSLLNSVGRLRGEQIKFHLAQGTFREVIVSQALRPTSAQGDLGIEPNDLLPAHFRLEPLAQKRFGTRWIRLSRLVAIDPVPRKEEAKAQLRGLGETGTARAIALLPP